MGFSVIPRMETVISVRKSTSYARMQLADVKRAKSMRERYAYPSTFEELIFRFEILLWHQNLFKPVLEDVC